MPEVEISTTIPSVPSITPAINQPVKAKRIFLPIAVVAVVFLISGLAFGSYQLGKSQVSAPVSATVPNPSLTPVVPTDPTNDWNTYTSAFLGVSFKYPSEWNLKEASYGVVFEIEPDPRTVVGACPGYVLSVTTRLDPNETQKAFLPVLASTLNNQPVEVFEKTDEYGCLTKRIYVNKFPKEGYTPKLVISLGGKKPRFILDQILSTYKFL